MTETDWLAGTDPMPMLEYLRGRASERKLRLVMAGCCRRVWRLLPDERSRSAVEVVERYVDDLASPREYAAARNAALAAAGGAGRRAAWAAYWAASRNPAESLSNSCTAAAEAMAHEAVTAARKTGRDQAAAWEHGRATGARQLALVVHEVVGNPFRCIVAETNWLRWRGGLVRNMARAIYEDGRYGDLPILADALEDAGCSEPDVLHHCREGGEHVRGCWVIDLLLGKG
jgi:hypothetical protein